MPPDPVIPVHVDAWTRVVELAWLAAWPPVIWWRVRELERQVHAALRDLTRARERLAALEGRART